jgi:hypothetical protein
MSWLLLWRGYRRREYLVLLIGHFMSYHRELGVHRRQIGSGRVVTDDPLAGDLPTSKTSCERARLES